MESSILPPFTTCLKDNRTKATIIPILSVDEIPNSLINFLCDEYNMEIERGETLPYFETLTLKEFTSQWFDNSIVGIMLLGETPSFSKLNWEQECLGLFNIKPNFPGKRCSHICTGEFLVNAGIRGKGIGSILTSCFIEWATCLNYESCVLNMVFETNVSARKLWESMNFKRVGRLSQSAYLKNQDTPVDSFIYSKNLKSDPPLNDIDEYNYRFDKIKHYLETGQYPKSASRKERASLRSNSSNYSLKNGKLFMKGKEVIPNPNKQRAICKAIHEENDHSGINKTTTLIGDKYHWIKIKEAVIKYIKECKKCNANHNRFKDQFEQPVLKKPKYSEHLQQVIQQAQDRLSYADVAANALKEYGESNVTTHVQTYQD